MLNNLMICGCILMYSEVFVNSVDNLSPNESKVGGLICMVRLVDISFVCVCVSMRATVPA